MASRTGGTGPTQPATAEVQELVDKVSHVHWVGGVASAQGTGKWLSSIIYTSCQIRPVVEQRSGRTFSEFSAVEYRTQVVAGTNFFVRVS